MVGLHIIKCSHNQETDQRRNPSPTPLARCFPSPRQFEQPRGGELAYNAGRQFSLPVYGDGGSAKQLLWQFPSPRAGREGAPPGAEGWGSRRGRVGFQARKGGVPGAEVWGSRRGRVGFCREKYFEFNLKKSLIPKGFAGSSKHGHSTKGMGHDQSPYAAWETSCFPTAVCGCG